MNESTDEQAVQGGQRQVERFAVAAIAFCLKHDEAFRLHFLQKICEDAGSPQPFDLSVEDHRWGDLVLTAQDRSAVFVVECKIKADLEAHQNPVDPSGEFWKAGYGSAITNRYGQAKRLKYIVLGYQGDLPGLPRTKRSLECSQRRWGDLKAGMPRTSLTSDLAETLSALQVSAFRSGDINDMSKNEDARIGCEVYRLLSDALDEVRLPGLNMTADISHKSIEDWYFGIAILKKRAPQERLKTLQELVDPVGNQIGWLGYAADDEPNKTKLSVWFYSSAAQAPDLQERLRGNGVNPSLIKTGAGDAGSEIAVEISRDELTGISEKDWFKSILFALLGR